MTPFRGGRTVWAAGCVHVEQNRALVLWKALQARQGTFGNEAIREDHYAATLSAPYQLGESRVKRRLTADEAHLADPGTIQEREPAVELLDRQEHSRPGRPWPAARWRNRKSSARDRRRR